MNFLTVLFNFKCEYRKKKCCQAPILHTLLKRIRVVCLFPRLLCVRLRAFLGEYGFMYGELFESLNTKDATKRITIKEVNRKVGYYFC